MTFNKLPEPKLTYAVDSSNNLVYIDDVAKGLNCNCVCPECKEKLIAKKGKERQPHFAHCSNNPNCTGGIMSAIHWLSENIIKEEKAVMVPAYKKLNAKKLRFTEVEMECRKDRNDLQPDVVGVTKKRGNERRWAIEIFYTNKINERKERKIKESNITCLEIDVSKQTLDKDSLKHFLLDSVEDRVWINFPEYERIMDEYAIRKIKLIENILAKKLNYTHSIILPPYNNITKEITLQKVEILHISETPLYLRIKGYASTGYSYIFNVGYPNSIKKESKQFEVDDSCSELDIYIDKTYELDSHNIKWRRNVEELIQKKRKEELRKQYNFTQKNILECDKCNLHNEKKCSYNLETMYEYGIEYVLCTKQNQDNGKNDHLNELITNYCQKLKKEGLLHLEETTEIIDLQITIKGSGVVVLHKSNNIRKYYVTLITFDNNSSEQKRTRKFSGRVSAENYFVEVSRKYRG